MTSAESRATRVAPDPDNVVRLPDGRLLGYGQYGDPDGAPLFLLHGMPGSRLEGEIAHEAMAAAGVRLIAPDRPGYGLSDRLPGRTIPGFAEDVVALADRLGVGRFGVAGVSGGGPYAAACAYRIPERLTAAGIVSGVGPFDAPGARDGMNRMNQVLFGLARRAPFAVTAAMALMARASRSPRLIQQMKRSMPAPDRAVLSDPTVERLFTASAKEAFRQGAGGAAQETVLYARPWGFRLQDIRMPVHLWQGGADANVPPSMGRYQASQIPDCREHWYPDEGHLLVITHFEEIARVLTDVAG
ncbi:MAG: alpha/beta hydrolase [Chloroflexi bacterium]|nr:alpha/beta hydrolase [Chloroflexota bacterium]